MSEWNPAPHHQQDSVHAKIVRLRYSVDPLRAERSWHIPQLRESVASDLTWDGRLLRHPEHGPLLRFRHEPDWRAVTLTDLPELLARPGDLLPPGPSSQQIRLRLERDLDCGYYGLGQRVCALRRDPGCYANWSVDPPVGHHNAMTSLYQSHPWLMVARPGLCLGIYLNTTWFSRFDLGQANEEEIAITTLGGEIDLYVLYAETPAELATLLAQLTGQPALPPLWALGYHQSRWGYKAQSEIEDLVDEFQARKIPLDVVHLDIDYMDDYRSFTFHPDRFPDPPGLTARLRTKGVRVVTIIDPGIRFDLHSPYPVAREGTSAGHFLRNADGSPFSAYCWPDSALFTDYARADARAWWGRQNKALTDAGVSGVWIDMNEPAVFARPFSEGFSYQAPIPLATQHGQGSDRTVHAEVHNLYGHLMAQATREGLQQLRPDERPWVLTRSAFMGSQRFCWSWMGDNNSWWEHLAKSLPQLLGMGQSGSPFVGVDIGGFFGNCSGELLQRWMEPAVFYPLMRNHTAVGTRAQEPWAFGPEVEATVAAQIRLRYRFLPYLYTLSHQAHHQGWPILRALFHEFPQDTDSYLHDDQAMCGPWLMFAPVTRPGHTKRMVYFPPGKWFDFWTERSVEGPCYEVCPAPMGQMPIFLREGACIPMSNERLSTSEPITQRIWLTCPGSQPTQGIWIDEEGQWTAELSSSGIRFPRFRPALVIVRGERTRQFQVAAEEQRF